MASSTLSQIGHFLSGDMLFFVVAFILFLIFTLYLGRGKMISLILAYYPATVLYTSIPFIDKILFLKGDSGLVLNKIGIFLIIFIPLSIIMNYYIFSESISTGASHLIRTSGFALIALILMVMFSYSTVNYDVFHNFSGSIDSLFVPATRIFYWNVGIFALLAFL
ncbi:MAG: hypothetical protein AB201_01535 [Parcubacteria bacterium C7867-006]|nr:MAG: hypothetical protein AB201_01535 [Parcubacteria bacterium C7867-006]